MAAAAAAVIAPVPAAGAATGATGWTATHTQALRLNGRRLGAAPSGQRLTVSVVLPLRNAGEINSLVAARRILSPAQVRATFSPTAASASTVARYLRSQGFTNISTATNRLLVTGTGTVAAAQRAFDTSISDYALDGKQVYANTAPAQVPARLGVKVAAVLGLSNVPMGVPASPQAGSPDVTGFSPQAIQKAYQATGMAPASNTTIAVIASGDMTPIIDNLRYAETKWGFPQVPVDVVYDGPQAGIVDNNPLTGNAEWDLDTQISTMMAQDVAALRVYDIATFTDPEVARGINMFVSEDKATALSISLGECDYIAFLDGAMVTTDEALAEGALQGQSAFASTGDNGYACPEVASSGVPEGPPGVSWPSDGEYTTAVGGTSLVADSDGNVSNEIAWIGGGGGISPWETAAPWTLQANGAGQTWEFTNQGGRSVPDVSAVADPLTPVLIYADSSSGATPEGVGGTSVASPLTMGLWARIEGEHGNALGLAQQAFYAQYVKANPATTVNGPLGPVFVPATSPGAVKGFRDITVGTNGGCAAVPGYDYCTGIGVLQTADLSAQLK